MYPLFIVTASALLASLMANRRKTWRALGISLKRFTNILPAFSGMLILFSVAIVLLPASTIEKLLGGDNPWLGVLIASVAGSVTLMPGFIAFPLCGALLQENVPYMVLAAFTTTMMSVGILTCMLEEQYFGWKVTIARNSISLLVALTVAIVTGLVFGEIWP